MIRNKRRRVVEELWRDYPDEIRWRVYSGGDMDGLTVNTASWVAWFRVKSRRWYSSSLRTGQTLETIRADALWKASNWRPIGDNND